MIEVVRDNSLVRHVHISDARLLRDAGIAVGKISDVDIFAR